MITISENVFNLKISSSAKLFYGWLNSTNCTNKELVYYANKFSVSTVCITNWLKELQKTKLIKIKNKKIIL